MSKKPETSPDTIEEVSEETPEVNEFEVKYQETLDRLLRTTAEYDNFRKRSQKEKEAMNQNAQADFAEKILPVLNEEERGVYRRGRNTRVNSVPKNADRAQYHAATGLEALFGWLYLNGCHERLNELFAIIMEEE